MKSLASFILRGPGQAILVAVGTGVLAIVLPPLSLISGAAVALTTMRIGPGSGLTVMVGGTAFVSLIAWMSVDSASLGLMFLGIMWLPLWLLGWVLRETRSLAMTVLVAGGVGVLGIVAAYAMLGDTTSWWEGVLSSFTEQALQAGSPLDPEEVNQAIATLSRVMTGVLTAGLVLNSIMCLFLARGWQAQIYNPGGFRDEFYELRLGRLAAMVSLVIIIFTMVPVGALSSLAIEVLIVVMSLYVIQGLAVIHAIVMKRQLHIGWLVGLYLVVFFMPQLMALIALLGLIDAWIDFRRRIVVRKGG